MFLLSSSLFKKNIRLFSRWETRGIIQRLFDVLGGGGSSGRALLAVDSCLARENRSSGMWPLVDGPALICTWAALMDLLASEMERRM